MCGHQFVFDLPDLDPWASDDQWNVDILVEAAFLSRIKTMLRDVVPIVGGVDDVGVIKNLRLLEARNKPFYEFINCLKSLETSTIEPVVIFNHRVVELRKVFDPTCSTVRLGIISCGE